MLQRVNFRFLTSSFEFRKLSQKFLKWMVIEDNSRSYHRTGIFDEDDESTEYRNEKRFDDFYERKPRRYSGQRENFNFSHKNNRFNDRTDFNRQGYQPFASYGRNNSQPFGQDLKKPIFDVNNLSPVEKYFYAEHHDVSERSMEEVKNYRNSLNISVQGLVVPKPITSFSELTLPDELMKVLNSQEYTEPTPIQSQGWPIALSGRDMVGVSQTGSGKTLVFMLPAIIHAMNQESVTRQWDECKPQVLVMAPTRELVQQIYDVSSKFVSSSGLLSCCAYGGASKVMQRRNLNGSQICIATPGRLIDFVSENSINLQQCTYVVLDEADRMLDMGFEPQIRKIMDQIRPDRQTLMWSATWPKEIQALAEDFLKDYIQVTVGSPQLSANPNIEQNIYVMREDEKENRLFSLLKKILVEEGSKVLIFAQTKRKVDHLNWTLNSNRFRSMCIHGDISQSKRDAALKSFRKNKACVLIATDVAARGLDITDIDHVINYDFPLNIEDYIHRIGRTARGSASGVAHSFFTSENAGIIKDLLSVLKQAGQTIDSELLSIANTNQKMFKGNRFTSYKRNFGRREYAFN